MFTGIIEEVGVLEHRLNKCDIHQYAVLASNDFVSEIKSGDSIAVDGVCLTAYQIENNSFMVDVSEETQKCTHFGQAMPNRSVNLERALTPKTRMGGHFVSGHIDGIGELSKRDDKENESVLWFCVPSQLVKYIATKGSISINGVSLTINDTKKDQFCVTIIPHTLTNTNLKNISINEKVNIEVDLIARYLEQLAKYK